MPGCLPIHFSLKKKPEEWAEMILSESKVKRKNMEEEISSSGYDIQHEIRKIEKFYIVHGFHNI